MTGISSVTSFLRISELAIRGGELNVRADSHRPAGSVLNDPNFDDFFTDKSALLEKIGGVEGWAEELAIQNIEGFRASVESAAIVFAHSIVDAISFDFCKCIAIAHPQAWESILPQRKVELQKFRDSTYEEILSQLISKHLDVLERESLIRKGDELFRICKPKSGFDPIEDFEYDRDRLVRIDNLRHEIVHGPTSLTRVPTVGADLTFLQNTATYYMALLNDRFNFKLRPELITEDAK